MSRQLNIKLIGSKTLGQANSLELVLGTVQKTGFQLNFIEVGNFVTGLKAFWREFNDQVLNELGIAYENGELSFHAIEVENKVPIAFTVELTWSSFQDECPTTSQISLTAFETAIFKRKEYEAERNCQKVLSSLSLNWL